MACRLFSAKPFPQPNTDWLSIGPLGINLSEVHKNEFENGACEMQAILSRERWVNPLPPGQITSEKEKNGSSLLQITTANMQTPSQYLEQGWLNIHGKEIYSK